MFKRVTKQVRKKAKEEKSGITEELGAFSASDSDESSESANENVLSTSKTIKSGQKLNKTSRKQSRRDKVETDEGEDEASSEAYSSTQEQAEGVMTVKEALKSSLFENQCVICPGKVLKNPHMEKIHLESAHHKRRFKRFEALVKRLATKFDDIQEDSVDLVVQLMEEESEGPKVKEEGIDPSDSGVMSKRAQKRKRIDKQKEKRKRRKQNAKTEVPLSENHPDSEQSSSAE